MTVAAAEHQARLAKDRYDAAGVAYSEAFEELRAAYDALERELAAEQRRLMEQARDERLRRVAVR